MSMRLHHMITCSEAVNPPVRLANFTLGECSCLLLRGWVLVVADQHGGFHRALILHLDLRCWSICDQEWWRTRRGRGRGARGTGWSSGGDLWVLGLVGPEAGAGACSGARRIEARWDGWETQSKPGAGASCVGSGGGWFQDAVRCGWRFSGAAHFDGITDMTTKPGRQGGCKGLGECSKFQAFQVPGRPGSEAVEVEETLGALDRARRFGYSKLSLQRLVFVHELVECAHDVGYDATVQYLLPIVQNLASDPEVLVRQSLMKHFCGLAGRELQRDAV
eukprot:s1779_g2.t1